MGGGLALGKEGPLVHIGACIASLLGQVSVYLFVDMFCEYLGHHEYVCSLNCSLRGLLIAIFLLLDHSRKLSHLHVKSYVMLSNC